MASDRDFVQYVCSQLRNAGDISSRRMFGEAAIYCEQKVVGLVCDNQFFVKPTEAGRARVGVPTEAAPYPGASKWFLMADLDDTDFLSDLIRITATALPPAKIKTKTKKSRRSKSKIVGKAKRARSVK